MAIAYDNVSSTHVNANAGTTVTWSHTVNANTNGYLVVGVGYKDGDALGVTGVTYNSVAMTPLADGGAAGGTNRAYLFGLKLPDTGAHDVVVTFSGTGTSSTCGALSYTGVDQTAPVGTKQEANGASTVAGVTVTSATGEVVVAAACWEQSGTPTESGTRRWKIDGGDDASAATGGGQDRAGAASTVMTWTFGGNNWFSAAGIPLKPAGAGPTTSVRDMIGRGVVPFAR